MIVSVDDSNIEKAAIIHSEAWKESHRAFCKADFVEMHTSERQKKYLSDKIKNGSNVFILIDDNNGKSVGIVSVTENLIEDLYVLPSEQNKGYGTTLLHYAISKCHGVPTLWILENNENATRLYRREGFLETGRRNYIDKNLDEIEFIKSE